MSATKPRKSTHRVLALCPAGHPDKKRYSQLTRKRALPLSLGEMRMACVLTDSLSEEHVWKKHKTFASPAHKAGFLLGMDPTYVRDLRNFRDLHGEYPMEEITTGRGRKRSDMRSTRFPIIRNTIRVMNLRGENPTYSSVAEKLKTWGYTYDQVRWACGRMGIVFAPWKRKEALKERDYVVRNRNDYVKRELELKDTYARGERVRVWSDETYCNKNHVSKMCLHSPDMTVNQPSGVGPRWNIIHWMVQEGNMPPKLLEDQLDMWIAKKCTGDYHQEYQKNVNKAAWHQMMRVNQMMRSRSVDTNQVT